MGLKMGLKGYAMPELAQFREETRAWLEQNCPASMRTRMAPGERQPGRWRTVAQGLQRMSSWCSLASCSD
jgi:hypothetical protein